MNWRNDPKAPVALSIQIASAANASGASDIQSRGLWPHREKNANYLHEMI